MKRSNPVYTKIEKMEEQYAGSYAAASYKGIGVKVLVYLLITLIGAGLGIYFLFNNPSALYGCLLFSGLLTFIFALLAMSIPKTSMICGTLYCLFEGIFIGVLSLLFEAMIGGIILAAALGTLSVVGVVSVLYFTGLVKVGNGFYKFLFMFAIGFIVTNILMLILSLFPAFNNLFDSYGVILLVSAISVLLASLFLLSDLKQATTLVESGAPKEFEWMVAFGIAYTVLWLYIEILRILAIILARSDN